MSKMARQLNILDQIYDIPASSESSYGVIIGPDDLIRSMGISQRMLQRDLKDLRDCGLINVKYSKSRNRYIDVGNPTFDESAGERRKQHLRRLYRLGTLIIELSRTPVSLIEEYESGILRFNEYVEWTKEDPETFPPESIDEVREEYIPDMPPFYDLKAEYYSLFPNSNERTRQRDFKELSDAGFCIYYSKEYKTYIFEYDDLSIGY